MPFSLARTLRTVALSAVAALTVGLVAGNPANATGQPFPGAGFTVASVRMMTTSWRVPAVQCTRGENDAVVFGMMGPAVGTLAGWNAASLSGCSEGHPWYRIQTWCNAVGGGFQVAPAEPGDLVVGRLSGAATLNPSISVQDYTHPSRASYRLKAPATVVANGAYAGTTVPQFATPALEVTANGGLPLSKLLRARHQQWHGAVLTIDSGYVWHDGKHFTLYFRHR